MAPLPAVEISTRAFRDLLRLAETRTNLVPVLGDATKPEPYGGRTGVVDILYQDVAQRDQAGIFLKNFEWVRPEGMGYLLVKARSEDIDRKSTRLNSSHLVIS